MLNETSSAVKGPSPASAEEYCRKAEAMASAVTETLCAREDLESLIGSGNTAMMRDNHANHARFVCALLRSFDPNVVAGTVAWVVQTYMSHGFSARYWEAQYETWKEVLPKELSPAAFAQILPVYDLIFEEARRAAGPSGLAPAGEAG